MKYSIKLKVVLFSHYTDPLHVIWFKVKQSCQKNSTRYRFSSVTLWGLHHCLQKAHLFRYGMEIRDKIRKTKSNLRMYLFTIAITVPVILGLYGVILFRLSLVRWNRLPNGRLAEIKNNRKCHNVSPKSGRCRLREVVAYERFQLKCFDP